MDLRKWYRALEMLCQLGAFAAFVFRVVRLLPKATMGIGELIELLPLPAMFIMLSLVFRYLGTPRNTANADKGPLIMAMSAMLQSVNIGGMHLIALTAFAITYILFLISRDPDLKELANGLFGFFLGLEVEKRTRRHH